MALEDIFQKIKNDAEQKIEEINKKTEEVIKQIEMEGREKLETEREKIIDKARKDQLKIVKQARLEAEAETRNKILERKTKALEDVYYGVLDELEHLDGQVYNELLNKLYKKIPHAKRVGFVIAEGRKEETKKFLKNKGVEILGDIKSKGGFIVKSEDLEVDNTFEAILRQAKEEKEMNVIKILF